MTKINSESLKELVEEFIKAYQILKKKKTPRRKSTTPKAIANKGRFSIAGKFAGPINKNKYLYQAWKKSKVEAGWPLNRITKTNREICLPNRPSKENVISPPGGFPFKLIDFEYKQEDVHIKIEPIKINEDEKKIVCLLYFSFYESKYPENSYYKHFVLSEVKESVVEEFQAAFNLNRSERNKPNLYNKCIIYLCAVTLNRIGNVVRWSETVSVELDVPIIE